MSASWIVVVVVGFVVLYLLSELATFGLNSGVDQLEAAAKARQYREGAKKIRDEMRSLFVADHEYAIRERVDPPVRGLDAALYREFSAWSEGKGLRWRGDVEDLTATRVHPKLRSAMRVATLDDGSISAAAYHIRVRGVTRLMLRLLGQPTDHRVVEMETELSDGRFLSTTNASAAALLDPPPQLLRELVPGLPWDAMLERHKERVAAALAATSGLSVVPAATIQEVLAAQGRQNVVQAKWREGRSVTVDELRRIGGGADETTDGVALELARLEAEERLKGRGR